MRPPVLLATFAATVAAMGCGRKEAAAVPGFAGGSVIQWGTSADDLAEGVAVGTDGHVWVGGYRYDGQLTIRRFTATGVVDLDAAQPARAAGPFGFSAALGKPFMMALDGHDADVEIAFDSGGAVQRMTEVSSTAKRPELAVTGDGTTYVGLTSLPGLTAAPESGSLSKVASDGIVLWTRDLGEGDAVRAVAADGTSLYAATGPAVELTGTGNRDVAVVTRFTPDGDVVWTRQLDDPTGVDVAALAVAADGGVIATGRSGSDAFVARWDAEGNRLWTTPIARAGFLSAGQAIAIAGDGSVAVAGASSGPEQPVPGAAWDDDVLVAALDATGAIRWTRVFGTRASDGATGVAFDAASNVYVCGYTFGTFPGSTSAGGTDQFLARLTPDGELR